MYGAIALWLGRLPGGLLHTNVGASALFSAVSGSSVSTAATIATVALPSFRRRKYDDRLVLGSIAAGASLGNLIPPGIAFIVYASLTNTSVGQLYAAAIIPSIMMTLLFMLTIVGAALLRPDLAGEREPRVPLRERIVRARRSRRPVRGVRHHHGLGLHRLGDGDGVRRAVGDRRARHCGGQPHARRSACCTTRSSRPRT